MVGISDYLGSAGGKFYNHSAEFLCVWGNHICGFDVILIREQGILLLL